MATDQDQQVEYEKFAYPLEFKVIKKCPVTKARYSVLKLPHATVETPQFMPVGTKGTLKGMLPHQIKELNCNLILANTYHLGTRPGTETLKMAGGLHKFMNWDGALLTDSGGYQMVSLCKLSEVTEEGVKFQSPVDGSEILLTPEKSMEIQNAIGSDIMMQLDDVISSTVSGPRVEVAMWRSLRWLDRCVKAHNRKTEQNLFPIVQGGLDPKLRTISANEVVKRNMAGYAIGGLSGGEAKDDFWRMVHLSTDILPKDKPRYLMGVGFAIDLLVCSALGCDLFDCVYPTRTARFGVALIDKGQLNLKRSIFEKDFRKIDDDCDCYTCKTYTRAFLYTVVNEEAVGSTLLTIHNVAFQMRLMKRIRDAIKNECFVEFVKSYVRNYYTKDDDLCDTTKTTTPTATATATSTDTNTKNDNQNDDDAATTVENKKDNKIPDWVINVLSAVNINIEQI